MPAGAGRVSGCLRTERDALGQGQLGAPVNRVGLATHVGLPGVGAGFAPAAGFLFTAERAADFGAAGSDVHVGDAAVAAQVRQERLGFKQVGREDRGAQALRDAVVRAEGLFQFFLGDPPADP